MGTSSTLNRDVDVSEAAAAETSEFAPGDAEFGLGLSGVEVALARLTAVFTDAPKDSLQLALKTCSNINIGIRTELMRSGIL